MIQKLFMICILFSSSISLLACAGGSGGSGGSGDGLSSNLKSTFTVSEVTGGMDEQGKLGENYQNSNDGGGLEKTLETSGLTGKPGEAGKDITVEHGNSIHVKMDSLIVEFETGDNGDTGIYGTAGTTLLAVAEKDVDSNALSILSTAKGPLQALEPGYYKDIKLEDEYFTGTVAYGKQFLQLNAGLVELEHSSFGAWGVETMSAGTWKTSGGAILAEHTADTPYREIAYTPLSGGDTARLANPSNGAFTGKVIAMATDYGSGPSGSPLQKFFTGDASLTVASASTGTLDLSFPNFYNIGFNLEINGSGFQAVQGSSPTITGNNNTSGINLQGTVSPAQNPAAANWDDTYLTGNFYGSSSATEATGHFNVNTYNGHDDTNLSGSFGVKQ
ncbi:MAG: hypothetical protein IJD04_07625 [Desulfovibrionaceae bacterium]|nr:hypothetical protein [Desulfovibrionaceae bacterium]